MTIEGWVVFCAIALFTVFAVKNGFDECIEDEKPHPLFCFGVIVLTGAVIFASYKGLNWYFTETATGRRAVVEQRSDFNNGLERTINILNTDGEVIRTYTGIIDVGVNNGGYVMFEYNGEMYTYYNCYLESIADIGE